jgi:hypothetical protein
MVLVDAYIKSALGCKKTLPIISKLKKTEKQESIGNRNEAKKILLGALKEIHKFNITEADFFESVLLVGNQGLSVSPKKYITVKLKKLGWKRKSK